MTDDLKSGLPFSHMETRFNTVTGAVPEPDLQTLDRCYCIPPHRCAHADSQACCQADRRDEKQHGETLPVEGSTGLESPLQVAACTACARAAQEIGTLRIIIDELRIRLQARQTDCLHAATPCRFCDADEAILKDSLNV